MNSSTNDSFLDNFHTMLPDDPAELNVYLSIPEVGNTGFRKVIPSVSETDARIRGIATVYDFSGMDEVIREVDAQLDKANTGK